MTMRGGLNDIEPSAFATPIAESGELTVERACTVSIAISLKRIADALTYQSGAEANLFDHVRWIQERLDR